MPQLSPPAAFTELPFYSAHFMDPLLWEPFVRHVALLQGFTCRRLLPALPGTYPTFIVELSRPFKSAQSAVVVKFFGPLFDGQASFDMELAMGQLVSHPAMLLPSPAVLASGRLAPGWFYLVFEHIPGTSLGQLRSQLSPLVFEDLARQMGSYMRALHDLSAAEPPLLPSSMHPLGWDGFIAFLEAQRARCSENHQAWADLPAHLLDQLPGFLAPIQQLVDLSSPAHLIHADLTADNLLGRLIPSVPQRTPAPPGARQEYAAGPTQPAGAWQSLAIIDWGDARVGNILYELVALHLDLFQADKHLLRLCLQAYQLPIFYQSGFARKAFSMVLLHQFPMPATLYAPYRDARSLGELAEGLFGF